MDAKEDVLDLVKGVGNRALGAVDAEAIVKDAQDAKDAEDLVLVRVHRKEKVRLVPHAIVALAVLVRVLHVHLVEDVLDQVDAEACSVKICCLEAVTATRNESASSNGAARKAAGVPSISIKTSWL